MYQIDVKSIQRIFEINRLLNMFEVKGRDNIYIMYNIMANLEEVMGEMKKQLETPGISIDTTKDKK